MTHNTREVEELVKKLRTVSDMINMHEKIRWGQETELMDKAADALETLHHQLQKAQERERDFAGTFMTPEDGAVYLKALSELDQPNQE